MLLHPLHENANKRKKKTKTQKTKNAKERKKKTKTQQKTKTHIFKNEDAYFKNEDVKKNENEDANSGRTMSTLQWRVLYV